MSIYGSISGGNTYFTKRVISSVWNDATNDEKTRALEESTRRINRLNFSGDKAVSTQNLEFPRDTDTTVPTDVTEATYESAYALLDGVDPELEHQTLGQTNVGFGAIRATKTETFVPVYFANGIPSSLAWSLLVPYLRDPNSIVFNRVD